MFSLKGFRLIEPIRRLKGTVIKTSSFEPHTFDLYEELGRRNEARVKTLIEEMGDKYLCHPNNRIKRLGVKHENI